MTKKIPQSLEGEAAVLGSMILSPEHIPLAEDELKTDMFFNPKHQIVFSGLLKTYNIYGIKADLVLLRNTLKGKLREAGGVKYLVKLAESVPSAASIEHYINIVREKWQERLLLKFAVDTMELVQGDETAEEKYIKTNKALSDAMAGSMKVNAQNVKDTVQNVTFDLEKTYLPTHYKQLDEYIYGLGKGDMVTIAGRPSMGKTAFMLDLAMNLTQTVKDKAVAVFSLEMSRERLQQRMICSTAKINIKTALKGYATKEQKEYLDEAKNILQEGCNIIIDETANISPSQLKAKILRMNLQHGLSAVFIDRIGLMKTDGWSGHKKWEKVTEISNMIKSTAMQLQIPIVILAQLNRDVDKRDDKRPRLSDLRHSGAIEEDSNVVLLLYRPGYYEKTGGDEAEIIIAKNTQGETGKIDMIFIDTYAHFEEPK